MMIRSLTLAAALTAGFAFGVTAATTTDPAAFSAGATVETFDAAALAGSFATGAGGQTSFVLDGFTVSAFATLGAGDPAVATIFQWGVGGAPAAPASPAGLFGGRGLGVGVGRVYEFSFAAPVAEFGIGVFDVDTAGATLSAFDSGGTLLESFVFAAANGAGQFGGVLRGANEISRLVFTPAASGDAVAFDGAIYFARPDQPPVGAVPAPAALPLLATGLVAFGLLRIRRRG